MDDFLVVHSTEVEPDDLRHLLTDSIAEEQIRQFRRFFGACFAVVIAGVWLVSWPVHLLPHTVFWALAATASFVIVLMSPRRIHAASPDRRPKPLH